MFHPGGVRQISEAVRPGQVAPIVNRLYRRLAAGSRPKTSHEPFANPPSVAR